MIKGINRQVVEINNTGSEVFERILIVLKPEYCNISKDAVAKETDRIVKGIIPSPARRVKRKKKKSSVLDFFDKF